MALVIPVILCGGSGARLWPLSPPGFPKQFLVLSRNISSENLFQRAIMMVNLLARQEYMAITNLERQNFSCYIVGSRSNFLDLIRGQYA